MKNEKNTPANFNSEDLLNSIFSGVQKPENAAPVGDILDTYGLNWSVSKEKLLLPTGADSGFFGIVREDTQKTFTTCKEGYVPFQNSELAEMLIRISEKTGYALKGGGAFNGGCKVFLQLQSPNKIEGIGANRDAVNGFLTGINSHDGSNSLKWGETNITISCKNTFFAALRELKQSARHTASIHDRVEQAIKTLSGVITEEKNLFERFIQLSEIAVKPAHVAKIVKDITEIDILNNAANKDASAYSQNRAAELMTAIKGETNQKGQTLWGLFSGVTKYTTHTLPTPNRENARLESIYTGSAFQINNEAFATLSAFANN